MLLRWLSFLECPANTLVLSSTESALRVDLLADMCVIVERVVAVVPSKIFLVSRSSRSISCPVSRSVTLPFLAQERRKWKKNVEWGLSSFMLE